MGTITASLAAAGNLSPIFHLSEKETATWAVAGDYTGSVRLEKAATGLGGWALEQAITAAASGALTEPGYYRFKLAAIDAADSPINVTIADVDDIIAEWRTRNGALAFRVRESGPDLTALTGLTLANAVGILSGEGAPEDAVQATLSRNPAGDDNALTFTAVEYGAGGNDITIAYVDPAANDAELSVVVTVKAIVVNLATDESGVITSTAADVLAAIEASPNADALVTVAINAADTGVGDDGSGIVTALAAAAMTGGEGTGIGTAGPGSLYIDYDTPGLYQNDGTLAVPTWTAFAT